MDPRRYHGLDALRGVVMMLGIVIHAAVYFLAYPPLPVPLDPSSSPVFDVIVVFVHSFRMPLFFVLAGFFASLLVEKYGIAGSYRNRVKRVLLPLLLSLEVRPETYHHRPASNWGSTRDPAVAGATQIGGSC